MTDDDLFLQVTRDIIVACKARDRYFDLDAVREPAKYDDDRAVNMDKARATILADGTAKHHGVMDRVIASNPAGAPPLDWWNLPWQQIERRIVASMCPEKVCTTCGKASRRIVEKSDDYAAHRERSSEAGTDLRELRRTEGWRQEGRPSNERVNADYTTLGWTDCQHGTWRPGHVLDPFAGSATTLAVAHGHGRDATGIDLDPRNAELAYGRLGMFLEVEDLRDPNAVPPPDRPRSTPKNHRRYADGYSGGRTGCNLKPTGTDTEKP